MTRLLPMTALLLCACGATSPGGGTQRLFVTAHFDGDGTTFGGRIDVAVRDRSATGERLDDASVTVRGGALEPARVPWNEVTGTYTLGGLRHVPGLRLEVQRGDDWLDGSLDVPGVTLITEPINEQTYRRDDGQPLVVRWRDESGVAAATTVLTLRRAGIIRTLDPGAMEALLEPGELTAANDELVRVERRNEVELYGGAGGSVFTAGAAHSITFTVE